MPAKILFLLGALVAMTASAENYDLSVQGSLRSYPRGGGLSAQAGYNALIWGDRERPPWFGFARVALESSTALTYNAAAVTAEVYPVGFLALRAGSLRDSNTKDYTDIDCAQYDCLGSRTQNFFEAKMAFAAEGVFVVLKERAEWWRRESADPRPFAEPASSLALSASGSDRVRVSQIVLGAPVTSEVKMLLGNVSFETEGLSQASRQVFLAGLYRQDEFSFLAGIGQWRYAVEKPTTNILLQAAWTPVKGWSLF